MNASSFDGLEIELWPLGRPVNNLMHIEDFGPKQVTNGLLPFTLISCRFHRNALLSDHDGLAWDLRFFCSSFFSLPLGQIFMKSFEERGCIFCFAQWISFSIIMSGIKEGLWRGFFLNVYIPFLLFFFGGTISFVLSLFPCVCLVEKKICV